MSSAMPTYTCDKCARTFSQKSHFTAHQNKKIDCSLHTNISQAITNATEKEVLSYGFHPTNYQFHRIKKPFDGVMESASNSVLEQFEMDGIAHTVHITKDNACQMYMYPGINDIIELSVGIVASLIDKDGNVLQFTREDLSYLPVCALTTILKVLLESIDGNPHDINIFTLVDTHADKYRKAEFLQQSVRFKDGMAYREEQVVKPLCFRPEDIVIVDIQTPADPRDVFVEIVKQIDADGVSFQIKFFKDKPQTIHPWPCDILVIEDGMTVTVDDPIISLTSANVKYLPLVSLPRRKIMISTTKDEQDVKFICFSNRNLLRSFLFTKEIVQDSIRIKEGKISLINKSVYS